MKLLVMIVMVQFILMTEITYDTNRLEIRLEDARSKIEEEKKIKDVENAAKIMKTVIQQSYALKAIRFLIDRRGD